LQEGIKPNIRLAITLNCSGFEQSGQVFFNIIVKRERSLKTIYYKLKITQNQLQKMVSGFLAVCMGKMFII
jgi:hypothetical protein